MIVYYYVGWPIDMKLKRNQARDVRRVCADLDTVVKDQDDRIRQYTAAEVRCRAKRGNNQKE